MMSGPFQSQHRARTWEMEQGAVIFIYLPFFFAVKQTSWGFWLSQRVKTKSRGINTQYIYPTWAKFNHQKHLVTVILGEQCCCRVLVMMRSLIEAHIWRFPDFATEGTNSKMNNKAFCLWEIMSIYCKYRVYMSIHTFKFLKLNDLKLNIKYKIKDL